MCYKINLKEDINNIAGRWLKENGITCNLKNSDNILEFLRWLIIYIRPIKRKVYISKELMQSSKFIQYQNEISLIKDIFENGEDIMPFTSSRKSFKKGHNPYNDALLNDWGIHHLHLSLKKDKSGLAKRTKDLLFCFIDTENAYFIDIQSHSDSWANKKLLKIIDNNWGELLECYRIKDATPTSNYNSDEILQLRKININTIVTLDNGKSFISIGGGASMDGTPVKAVLWRNNIIKQLIWIEKFLKNNQYIANNINNASNIKLIDCEIQIRGMQSRLSNLLFQTNNGYEILIMHNNNIDNDINITILKNGKYEEK